MSIKKQLDNVFTKGLHSQDFSKFLSKLGMDDIYSPTLEGVLGNVVG